MNEINLGDTKIITGLILAGGQSSRLSYEDKGLIKLKDKSMIAHVYDRLKPQVDQVIISANRNIEAYKKINSVVVSDEFDDFRGPLAGIYEGLKAIKEESYLLVVPCDGPFLPDNLAQKLLLAIDGKEKLIASVFDGQYNQPAYSLIHQSMYSNLSQFLANGSRKLGQWLAENNAQWVEFSEDRDNFININRKEDLLKVEKLL